MVLGLVTEVDVANSGLVVLVLVSEVLGVSVLNSPSDCGEVTDVVAAVDDACLVDDVVVDLGTFRVFFFFLVVLLLLLFLLLLAVFTTASSPPDFIRVMFSIATLPSHDPTGLSDT